MAVEGGTVSVLRGDVSGVDAERVMDATGRVACPGFMDLHAHSALMVLANPLHEPKVFQGITTELIGIDGNSYAPMPSHKDLTDAIRLNSGLEGAPPLKQRWLSVGEYLDCFDGKVSCNIAYVMGNSAVRVTAMGWDDRPATGNEVGRMRDIVRLGMEEGAFGISTGLNYPPVSYADTAELVELSTDPNRLGGTYHTHVRYPLGDQFLDPYREALNIGRRSGIPIHIRHLFQRLPIVGSAQDMMGLVDGARAEGLDVTFDTFPSAYGGTQLIAIFPEWAHSGGPDALVDIIRSPEGRKELAKSLAPRAATWHDVWLTYFKQPHNRRWEGRSVADFLEVSGKSDIDALRDLLIEEDLQTSYAANQNNLVTMPAFLRHPLCMVGTDGLLLGDHPAPRTYAGFPYILGSLVREEGILSLTDAIRKMTSAPAQRLGLRDRGTLGNGASADIVGLRPGYCGFAGYDSRAATIPDGDRLRDCQRPDSRRPRGALPGPLRVVLCVAVRTERRFTSRCARDPSHP